MQIIQILPASRIFVDREGSAIKCKADALRMLSELLGPPLRTEGKVIEQLLAERERLQSTGIGDGVAIPHTSLEAAPGRVAALLLCPKGVPFDAIDGQDVRIVLGVVGPKEATGEHLRVLARVSRLLRDSETREALVRSENGEAAYQLIETRDHSLG
jgi:PTS system nitrogen regulatory IIA component